MAMPIPEEALVVRLSALELASHRHQLSRQALVVSRDAVPDLVFTPRPKPWIGLALVLPRPIRG
jgi:hypothetical protein